jgi:hypothetical protein
LFIKQEGVCLHIHQLASNTATAVGAAFNAQLDVFKYDVHT